MALHHRREIADMRSAYDHDNSNQRTYPSSNSDRSYQELHSGSDGSYQTQPTSYSSSPSKRPPHVHYNTSDGRSKDNTRAFFDDRHMQQSPQSSFESIASTVESEDELLEESELPEYDVPEYTARPSYEPTAIAATPSDFSELFPSHARLAVRHDDSTIDGNMNLRLDTEVSIDGQRCDMTLFHLRMHDLKNREFSLRRYCRDSGREVCHSARKDPNATAGKRPGLQRSLSNALHSIRPSSVHRTSTSPSLAGLQRNDSGYGSIHSMDFDEDRRPQSSGTDARSKQSSTNNIKLEFSNYAQVDFKRTGVTSKEYTFEYWGVHYAWKRISRKDRGLKEVSYHLTKSGHDQVLAFVVPVHLTPRQAHQEQSKGGWIAPCSMWIADESIIRSQKDLSDVVIATGLMALVDDSIRARFQSKNEKQLLIPVPKIQMGVEYIGPKRLINEMFSRKNSYSSHQSRPTSSSGRPSTSGVGAPLSRVPGRESDYEH